MQEKESSIEVKVGALVLVSIALFVGFVLVLGDFSFSDRFTVHVDFQNAGGLKPGADVAIAGIKVGRVDELEFQPGDGEERSGVDVRTTLKIDPEYTTAIREDSEFFVSQQGVLGEPYIEIETTSFDSPPAEDGAVYEGRELPRVDVIVAKATNILDSLHDMLEDPDVEADDFISSAASLITNLDHTLSTNREDIDATVRQARTSADEAAQLLAALNAAVGDGGDLAALLEDAGATAANARRISDRVEGDIDPVMEDALAAAANARRVSESVDRLIVDNEDKLAGSIDNVYESSDNLARTSEDASEIVRRIESGEGTVGQLLADREMYDDMKELLRTVKRRPWKMIWKE